MRPGSKCVSVTVLGEDRSFWRLVRCLGCNSAENGSREWPSQLPHVRERGAASFAECGYA